MSRSLNALLRVQAVVLDAPVRLLSHSLGLVPIAHSSDPKNDPLKTPSEQE
jgi:hypothetical protein